jgi:hypothetical protein
MRKMHEYFKAEDEASIKGKNEDAERERQVHEDHTCTKTEAKKNDEGLILLRKSPFSSSKAKIVSKEI